MFAFLSPNAQVKSHEAQIKVQKIQASKLTPLMVCEALNAPILLESAFLATGKGRFSILILQEAFRVLKENGAVYLQENGKKHLLTQEVLSALRKQAKIESHLESQKFLEILEAFCALSPEVDEELRALPLPLGGVGYLGYEFFSEIEAVAFNKPPLYHASESAFIFGRAFVIFDHFYECLYAIEIVYAGEVCAQLQGDLIKRLENLEVKDVCTKTYLAQVISEDKESYYTQMVRTLKEEIYKGNLLQCVPSCSLQIASDLPPLQAYRNLRSHNPSPYMYYLNFGDYQIIGSSPELLVKVQSCDSSAKVSIRPIAGTRVRGKNALEDAQLEEELKTNAKENAEHLMLLDLGRNDVGRVAIPGSVRVKEEKVVEKYARVMHLVSEVQGEMDLKTQHKIDALYAAFPAGTISGAPKIQAIKTIESLESHKRGIYAGAIGYFASNGDMDFAIAIRTAVYQKGVYYLQAGAGIVYDSNERAEYQEVQHKMLALKEAIMGGEK